MRFAHHLIRHPSGVYHFRFLVPADLREVFGVKVFKRSLHTTNPATARVWAYVLSAKYADLIRSLRGLDVSNKKPTVEDVLVPLKQSGRYEVEIGPNGFRLKTDGTDKDHHDALESIDRVSEEPWFKAMMAKAKVDETPQNKRFPSLSLVEAVKKWEEFLKPTTRAIKTLGAKPRHLKTCWYGKNQWDDGHRLDPHSVRRVRGLPDERTEEQKEHRQQQTLVAGPLL